MLVNLQWRKGGLLNRFQTGVQSFDTQDVEPFGNEKGFHEVILGGYERRRHRKLDRELD